LVKCLKHSRDGYCGYRLEVDAASALVDEGWMLEILEQAIRTASGRRTDLDIKATRMVVNAEGDLVKQTKYVECKATERVQPNGQAPMIGPSVLKHKAAAFMRQAGRDPDLGEVLDENDLVVFALRGWQVTDSAKESVATLVYGASVLDAKRDAMFWGL
jgi:hypothetical protein